MLHVQDAKYSGLKRFIDWHAEGMNMKAETYWIPWLLYSKYYKQPGKHMACTFPTVHVHVIQALRFREQDSRLWLMS